MEQIDFAYLKKFYNNNPLYLVCSLIYVSVTALMMGGKLFSWVFSFTVYVVSLAVIFSPLGEKLLRFIENVRPLYTKREKDYLLPIFEEVYQKARRRNRKLKIELCVIDQMYVNACALGTHTIAVTKGAMETFSEDELKAIISHEIGHIVNMDTIASLYLLIGAGLFSVYMIITKFIINLVERLSYSMSRGGFFKVIVSFVLYSFQILLLIFMLVMNLLTAKNSRANEYRADEFTNKLGYGQEMIEALYLLEKINLSSNRSILSKMLAKHPILPKRIANLESISDGGLPVR